MDGRGERIFAPGDGITRAEAASMFYRCLTEESRESLDERGDFADVRRGSWYYDAVTILAGAGVAEPRADGRFYPDEYITRAEFVTLAARASGLEPDYGPRPLQRRGVLASARLYKRGGGGGHHKRLSRRRLPPGRRDNPRRGREGHERPPGPEPRNRPPRLPARLAGRPPPTPGSPPK